MLRSLVAASLRLRAAVVILAAFLAGLGLWTASRTPLDVFPEFAPPFAVIQTEAPGLTTEEVEALVTIPLERALNGTTWLTRLGSTSQPGISKIDLFFERGSDPFKARQLVSERVAAEAARLPRGVGPPKIIPITSSTSRLLMVGLTSETVSPMDLRTLAIWTIRPRLLGVPGVASVTVFGGEEKQYQVLVDPERLHRGDVGLDDVRRAAGAAVVTGGAGSIDTPGQRLPVQQKASVEGVEDIASAPVAWRGGRSVLLGEVADVRVGATTRVGAAIVGDQTGVRSGVILIIDKQPWFNSLDVTRDLESAIDEIVPAFPEGVRLTRGIFRQASFIDHALSNLWAAMAVGCILVAAILFSFLAEWRTAVISLSAIPLSLLTGVLVLRQLGVDFNTMVLGGLAIAIGEVVDDAIIDVENILRRLKLERAAASPRPALAVVLDASLEVRSAVVYATFVVAMVFLPVFFLSGVEGSFFRPLAIAYIAAVLSSLAVALTVTPALSLLLLGREGREAREMREHGRLTLALRSLYRRSIPAVLRRPRLALAVAVALLAGAGALAPFLWERGEFLPDFRETNFVIHWIARPGTSLEEMERIGLELGRQVMAVPGVLGFGQHIGRAEESEDVGDTNFAENWISVDEDADYLKTIEGIDRAASRFPGITKKTLTFLRERIMEVLGEGSAAPIIVRIYGPDLGVLREKAEEVRRALLLVPGVREAEVEPQMDVPQVRIEHRRSDLARYGVTPRALQDAIDAMLAGAEVGQVYEEGKVFDLVVWGAPGTRADLEAVGRIPIDTPSGARVPISALADLSIVPAPNWILREDGSRRIDITCKARGRGIGAVAGDIDRRLKEIRFPPGHHAELRGEYRDLVAGRRQILVLSLVALLAIAFLLAIDFGSLRETGLILLSLPFALAGGAFAIAIAGLGLGLGALVGFVTVFGIAVRNGIMLLSHYRHLRDVEGMDLGTELVVRGAEERLAPILMTSLATGLALIPFALGGDRPGFEIEHPMAVVIIGGLFSSTALNILVLPALYGWLCARGGAGRRGLLGDR
jgi:CzcA family heavy metal efflux pump